MEVGAARTFLLFLPKNTNATLLMFPEAKRRGEGKIGRRLFSLALHLAWHLSGVAQK